MGITGRYNFPGMQKLASAGINLLLAATTWGAWLIASPLMPAVTIVEGWIVNWLANHGLIVLNVGVNIVDGVLDQAAMDKALDAGIKRVMQGRDKITPADGKAIDDKVREAFDKDIDLGATNASSVPNFSTPSI